MPENNINPVNEMTSEITKPDSQTGDQSDVLTEVAELMNKKETVRFFPVSEGKLITLYIVSFGMYAVYWFYKNWQLQQPLMDKKISPTWRAIFSIFFTHALFKRIDQQAVHLDKKNRFSANILATLFVAAIIVSNILDRLTMGVGIFDETSQNSIIIISLALFFLSIYPMVKVQATVNRINDDMLGYLNHKYSFWNYILVVVGSLLWLLFALGTLTELLT